MNGAITFNFSQPAARGPIYITYVTRSTDGSTFYAYLYDWQIDVYNNGNTVIDATPDVDDNQHDEPVNIAFSPSGSTHTFAWNAAEDISDTLYSSIAKLSVTVTTGIANIQTFTSGLFTIDMREAAEESASTTHLEGYLGGEIRLLYKRLENGSGKDAPGSPGTPQITHIYDADGSEQLFGSPPTAVLMTHEDTGAYYYDLSVSESAAAGTWSYAVLDGSNENVFYFTVRDVEIAGNYREDECVIAGYVHDVSGAALDDRTVKVTINTPYYLASSLTYPDFAPIIAETDGNGYLELHLPRNLHVIISIEDYKTSSVTVPNEPISALSDFI